MADEEITPTQDIDQRLADLEEKAEGQLEGLADHVSSAFWGNVKHFFGVLAAALGASVADSAGDIVGKASDSIGEKTEGFRQAFTIDSINEVLAREDDPFKQVAEFESWAKDMPLVGWIFKIVMLLMSPVWLMWSTVGIRKEYAAQSVLKEIRPSLLPLESFMAYAFKNPDQLDEVKAIITRYGFNDTFIDMLFAAATEKLSPEDAKSAYLRGLINEFAHDEMLKSHRYGDSAIELTKKLYEIVPPVQDLIVMAVREVFSPDVVERFGQMQDLPTEFVEAAKLTGLTPEWAGRYWAAHWSLPSALQGFEMLHRGVIDTDDLNLLLRALDIMPYWRDKLTQISYNPLTRVDVRRMYALGILDDEQVFQAYKNIGYNDDDAYYMTQFTIAYTTEKERELTRTDITTLFKRRVISEDETKTYLMNMGYNEINTTLIIQRALFEIEAEYKDKRIEVAHKLYVAGRITETEVYHRLGKLDLPSAEQSLLIETWDLERDGKVRYFTYEQISKLFANDILTQQQTLDELRHLGYSATDSNLLIQLMLKEKGE